MIDFKRYSNHQLSSKIDKLSQMHHDLSAVHNEATRGKGDDENLDLYFLMGENAVLQVLDAALTEWQSRHKVR